MTHYKSEYEILHNKLISFINAKRLTSLVIPEPNSVLSC